MRRPTNPAHTWPAPRVARWLEFTRSEFGAVDIQTDIGASYGVQVSAVELGPLSIIIVDVKNASGHVQQTSDASDRPPEDFFALTLILKGNATYTMDGKTVDLKEGDMILRDLARPWTIYHEDALKVLSLPLPYRTLIEHIHAPEELLGARFTSDRPETRLISGLVLSALELASDGVSTEDGRRTAALIIDALGLLGAGDTDAPQSSLLRAARRHIAMNYSDPALSSSSISSALNVTPKTLQRAFASVGSSLKSEVIQTRLSKAQNLLRTPNLATHSVTEIAFRVGFNDPNHFTRSFRSHVGQPPLSYRKAKL